MISDIISLITHIIFHASFSFVCFFSFSNGFGSSDNSADYPLNIQRLKIQKPFTYRHAETTFEKYTVVENLGTALIHDPDNFIKWENGADIQVTYAVPDDTWANYTDLRKYGAFFTTFGCSYHMHC